MDADGHQRRRIIWAIVAFLTVAWMRLSIGLENLIYTGSAIHNDPYQATVLENIGALADGVAAVSSMLPILCFTIFKICTGFPLMLFAICMVIFHSIKMGQFGNVPSTSKPKVRKEKSKHD